MPLAVDRLISAGSSGGAVTAGGASSAAVERKAGTSDAGLPSAEADMDSINKARAV